MSAGEQAIASRFRAALENAVRTGDNDAVLDLLASDVVWVTPQRTLRGVDEIRTWRIWGSSGEAFDFDFGEGDWFDHGDGRVSCDVREIYKVKETGDFAYERVVRVELTIRDDKISHYEVRRVG
jgi:ketosteroid isomerase-like protein